MGRWWPDEVRVCAEPGACLVLRAAGEEAGGGRRPETLTPSRASGRASGARVLGGTSLLLRSFVWEAPQGHPH